MCYRTFNILDPVWIRMPSNFSILIQYKLSRLIMWQNKIAFNGNHFNLWPITEMGITFKIKFINYNINYLLIFIYPLVLTLFY